MLEKNREDYEKFFDNFGAQLKYGCYDNFGANKDVLIDLIMFKSSKEDKYVTLKEYVSQMKKDQKEIYYASGESVDKIKQLPQLEKVLDKKYEVGENYSEDKIELCESGMHFCENPIDCLEYYNPIYHSRYCS